MVSSLYMYPVEGNYTSKYRLVIMLTTKWGDRFRKYCDSISAILRARITAVQTEVALSYHRVRGLYFLAVVFAVTKVERQKYHKKWHNIPDRAFTVHVITL